MSNYGQNNFSIRNELPIISDNSDARYRREIILSFPHQFEDGKMLTQ